MSMVEIGFGHRLPAGRVVAVLVPGSSPIRRLRQQAATEGRLIDATQGQKTRCLVVIDSNHVLLSAEDAECLSDRLDAALSRE